MMDSWDILSPLKTGVVGHKPLNKFGLTYGKKEEL